MNEEKFTDELRQVQIPITSSDIMMMLGPIQYVYRVQRKWLIIEKDNSYAAKECRNIKDIVIMGTIAQRDGEWMQIWYPVREEWRDLPIVTEALKI